MKKFSLQAILMGVIIFTFGVLVASAQVGDVDPLGKSGTKCLSLTDDLRVTSTGAQVFDLQFFLQSNGYLNSEPTGYFGLLTQGAVIRFQIDSGVIGTGFVGPLTRAKINDQSCNSKSKTVTLPTSTITPVGKSSSPITLEVKSGSERSLSEITVKSGEKFEINGLPKHSDGIYSVSWNFGSILDGSCSNSDAKLTGRLKFSCVTNKTGSTDVYAEIYKGGKTQTTNTIRVNVIENDEADKPEIEMVRGRAGDDFEILPKESIGIEGENLVSAGKDAEVFIDGESVKVTQYNKNVLYFTAPNLDSGKYDLQVRTSAGWSNVVEVYVSESQGRLPSITMVRGKALDDFEVNANEYTSVEGSDLIYSGKDTRVFIDGKEGRVTQYNEGVVYFIAPDMESGRYTLYVETSAGRSNEVTVSVNGRG